MLLLCSLSVAPLSLLVLIADWPAQTVSNDVPALRSSKLRPFAEIRPLITDMEGERSSKQGQPREQRPVGARKMSDDESEMFFMEYWQYSAGPEHTEASFTGDRGTPLLRHIDMERLQINGQSLRNASMLYPLQPPFSLHSERYTGDHSMARRLPRALSILGERAFQCPTGTSNCDSIGRPNSCCRSDETCQLITDTGQGDVGCCGQGQSCNNDSAGCQQGYQSCPGSGGGGCCIPGYTCVGVGCLRSTTSTVIVNPTVTASPKTSTKTSTTPASTTSSSTTTSTSLSSSTSTSSSSTSPTSSSTSSSIKPTSTSSISTAVQAVPPIRPTSLSSVTTTTTTSLPFSIIDTCPTGFYQCSAYYHGGCCRVGRDCALSDCPSATSTTIANTLGVTIVAPTGNGVGAATVGLGQGSCATGWSSCAASLGGGCCAPGYGCGSGTTCTATVAGETPSVEAKAATSDAFNIAMIERWTVLLAVLSAALFH